MYTIHVTDEYGDTQALIVISRDGRISVISMQGKNWKKASLLEFDGFSSTPIWTLCMASVGSVDDIRQAFLDHMERV